MPSVAFVEWSTVRQQRLENLVAAHRAVTGGGPGRKTLTEEINHALIVRLASEFQGFARALHDESARAFLTAMFVGHSQASEIIGVLIANGRKLDTGNATWGNIGSDFGRLGCAVASDLRARYPQWYPGWINKLDQLNRARNAVAHDDRGQIELLAEQRPLTLRTFRDWRSALSGVASGLDAVLKTYLKDVNGVEPW